MKKRIKIFAAFGNDVSEDMVRFGDFLCALNAQCREIEVSIFKDEKELCDSLEQSKEQIDGELGACDYFLLILGGKKDEYALDKLNRAIECYAKTKGNPDIHIFVNAAKEGANDVRRFFSSDEYEHYVEQFNYNDTLKAKFLVWLSARQKDSFSYEVDTDIHGTPVIKVGGVPVSGLVDFDALLNNEDYQAEKKKLVRKREERERYREELLDAKGEERNDLWDDISALAKEIEELQDKIAKMEKDTLALYQNYAKMTLASGYNSRLKRAVECIERGELERARRVLDPDGSVSNLKAIVNENEVLAARIEVNKKIAEQEINILFAEINRLKLDTGNEKRFEDMERCYENIEYFQEKLGLDVTVLFDYANFLSKQNKHNAAIEKYTKNLTRCQKLAKANPDAYLPKVAWTLNCLAKLQKYTNRLKESYVNYVEALTIFRKLAEANPGTYLSGVAWTLCGLSSGMGLPEKEEANRIEALEIYRRLAETNPDAYLSNVAWALARLNSEANYAESLKILRKLAETNPAYLIDVASILCNFALFQQETNRHNEAEANFVEALEIQRKFAETNPYAYLPDVAKTLDHLARLQEVTNRHNEVEANRVEALEIYQKLAKISPDVYLWEAEKIQHYLKQGKYEVILSKEEIDGLTGMLKYELSLKETEKTTECYRETETGYAEALEIYRKCAEATPDVYLPKVAMTLYNLAILQMDTNRNNEVESNCVEALEIYQKLTETNSDAYLQNVAKILNDLANLQSTTNRHDEAESNYAEALKVYKKLTETSPDAYLSHIARTLNNLAGLQYNTSRFKESEANFNEALEIYRNLAEVNPTKYLPYVAIAFKNLIEIKETLSKPEEAEAIKKLLREVQPLELTP